MKQPIHFPILLLILTTLLVLFTGCVPLTPSEPLPSEPLPSEPLPNVPVPSETDIPAALNQRQVLAMQLGLDLRAVEIANIDAMTWPDACLGKPDPTELCAPAETPGYRITLTANGGEYLYHTNEDGSSVRLAAAPTPSIGEQILAWVYTSEEGLCQEARYGADGVAFGRCGGMQMGVPFALEQRHADLTSFAGQFASFEADTPAGAIDFTGYGAQEATAAQQRMIAEWANLAQLEAQAGRSGASWGLVFAWHREGGIAGFCDDVSVYVTGEVYAGSCRGQEPADLAHYRLDAEQLTTIFAWIDTYAPFEYNRTDSAQADGMTVTLVFSGAGETTALEPDQAMIVDFAQNLFNESAMANAETPTVCLAPEEGQQLLVQAQSGYCLLYPAEYGLWQNSADAIDIINGTIMNHIDPRAAITVEAAQGRTLDAVVEQFMADYAPPGFNIEPQPMTVAGMAATLLDEVPGQDLTRRVVLINQDRLYTFFFAPIGDAGTTTRVQAEALYQSIIDSFRLTENESLSAVDAPLNDDTALPGEGPPLFAEEPTVGAVAFVRNNILYMQENAPQSRAIALEDCGDDACIILYPKWSPDGSRLLYYRGTVDGTGQAEIRIANRGGQVQSVADGIAFYRPAAWSPNGQQVVYLVNTDHYDAATLGQTHFFGVWTADVDEMGQSQHAVLHGEIGFGEGCGGGGRSNSANVYEKEGGFAYGYLAGIVEWTPANILLYSNNCGSRGVGRFDMIAGQELDPFAGNLRSLTLDGSGKQWAALDSENRIVLGTPDALDYRTLDNVLLAEGAAAELLFFGATSGRLYYTTLQRVGDSVDLSDEVSQVNDTYVVSPYFDFTQPALYAFDATLHTPSLLWEGDGYAYARLHETADGSILFARVQGNELLFEALKAGTATADNFEALLPTVDILRLAPGDAAPAVWLASAGRFSVATRP